MITRPAKTWTVQKRLPQALTICSFLFIIPYYYYYYLRQHSGGKSVANSGRHDHKGRKTNDHSMIFFSFTTHIASAQINFTHTYIDIHTQCMYLSIYTYIYIYIYMYVCMYKFYLLSSLKKLNYLRFVDWSFGIIQICLHSTDAF